MSPPDERQSRRAVLASGVAALASALAGCPSDSDGSTTGPPQSRRDTDRTTRVGRTTAVDGTAQPETVSEARDPTRVVTRTPEETYTVEPPSSPTPAGTDYRRVEIELFETTPRAIANTVRRGTERMEVFEENLVDRAIAGGTATHTSVSFEPLSHRIYLERDGTYYRIDRGLVDETDVLADVVEIRAVSPCAADDRPTTTPDESVPFSGLSAADRQVFRRGLHEEYASAECFSSDRETTYTDAQRRESAFLGESPTLVDYDGHTYLVSYEGTEGATERTYEFTADSLGTTFEAYRDAVVPEVVWHVDVGDLPAREREFFTELLADNHYESESPIPDYVFAFQERVWDNAFYAPEATPLGLYYLESNGTYYRYSFTQVLG